MKESRIKMVRTKSNKYFKAISTALRFRAKGDCFSTYAFDYVRVLDGQLICSNGHALCIVPIAPESYENGFYLPVADTATRFDLLRVLDASKMEFPDIEKIVKTCSGSPTATIENCHDPEREIFFTKIIRAMPKTSALNFSFYQLVSGLDKAEIYDKNGPIKFSSDYITAYVMPMCVHSQE